VAFRNPKTAPRGVLRPRASSGAFSTTVGVGVASWDRAKGHNERKRSSARTATRFALLVWHLSLQKVWARNLVLRYNIAGGLHNCKNLHIGLCRDHRGDPYCRKIAITLNPSNRIPICVRYVETRQRCPRGRVQAITAGQFAENAGTADSSHIPSAALRGGLSPYRITWKSPLESTPAGRSDFFGSTAAPVPSFNVWMVSTGRFSKRSSKPLGQRI
jgi:hypothetical protein